MAKYIKHNSNYIKTVRHQFLKDGSTIFERDWVTVGSQLNFGPGKIPYYNDGNFIFTTSIMPQYQKKHKNGVTVATWTYEDVKNALSTVNQINLDEHTEDIRSYAYYGSCVELVRVSIENIINTFPGNITVSDIKLDYIENGNYAQVNNYYVLNNPFGINTFLKDIQLTQYDNILHYLTYSWDKYVVKFNESENFTNIIKYEVITRSLYEKTNGNTTKYQMYEADKVPDGWTLSSCRPRYWLPNPNKRAVYEVKINNNIVIKGYIYEKELVALVPNRYKNMVIQPKDEVIEEYFNGLEGFERQLLIRNTKPLYSNRFVTPIEYNLGYLYYKRTYTWPSDGYCIDISSPRYIDFVNKLSNMAQLFDELWTDNLWRRMTHEAIKNYDWTYTREFIEGEEEDNIDGGERMHKVLNIVGRVFDDIKRTIDVIKQNNKTSYDEDRNIPNALLSDKLEECGWDIYSTIPFYEQDGEIISASEETITQEALNTFTNNDTYDNKWYPTIDANRISFADVDVEFMRRLLLSTNRIWQTKGTRHSIDMIMGMFGYGNSDEKNPDYILTEEYYTVKPEKYDQPVGDDGETFGDRIVRLNGAKQTNLLYDEDASGIPVASFAVDNDTYLIPFYNQNKVYDGDLYFQMNGGWCYNKKTEDDNENNPFGWTETVSYLHIASQVADLLNVNPNSIHNGDIYYVTNINDYIEFTEEPLYSNFFVLEDDFNPEKFNSWTNLNLEDGFYGNDASYTQEECDLYTEYAKKAKYLDSIIPYTIGNNPHVGYGNYDMGNEFIEYMKKPFKYSIGTDDIHFFETYDEKEEADNIEFNVNGPISPQGEYSEEKWRKHKLQILGDGENHLVTKTVNCGAYGNLVYNEFNRDDIKELTTTTHYLNSKVIRFKNNINNDEYKKYFRNVIAKYLMQVIPSTAILVLEGFGLSSEQEEQTTKIRVHFYYDDGHRDNVFVDKGDKVYNPNKGNWSTVKGSTDYFDFNTPIIQEINLYECVTKCAVNFFDIDSTTLISNTQVVKNTTINKPDDYDYYIRNGEKVAKNFPYTVIENVDFVRLGYRVIFYDYDKERNLFEKDIIKGEPVNKPSGYENDDFYEWDNTNHDIVDFSQTFVTKDLKFVRIVYRTVRFFLDENSTTPVFSDSIKYGMKVNKPQEYTSFDWYKRDTSSDNVVSFPYTVIDEISPIDFIKCPSYIEGNTVNWINDDTDGNNINEPITHTVHFLESEGNNATEIDTQQIPYGHLVFLRPVCEEYTWYEKGDSTYTPVHFPQIVVKDLYFVKLPTYTVEWYDGGE